MSLSFGRLVTGQRHELGDVHALVAHPLDAADDVQQRGDDAQIAGDRSLAGEQRENALVDLEVAAVDPVVVGDDHPGELDVLVADRLQRAVKLADDQVEAAERLSLELLERSRGTDVGSPACAHPNFPVT